MAIDYRNGQAAIVVEGREIRCPRCDSPIMARDEAELWHYYGATPGDLAEEDYDCYCQSCLADDNDGVEVTF